MKKIFSIFMIVSLAVSLCACSQGGIEDMTTEVSDNYAAMLYREINVVDIPDGWQSEYEWNQ